MELLLVRLYAFWVNAVPDKLEFVHFWRRLCKKTDLPGRETYGNDRHLYSY